MYLWNFLIKNTVNTLKLQFERSMVSCIPEKTFIQRWMFLMVPMVKKKKKKLTRYFRSMQCIFPLPLVICLCTYDVCTTWLPGDADLCLPNRTLPQPPSASHPRRASPQLLVPQPHGSCPSSQMWWDPHGASSSKHPQLLRSDHGWVLQENGGGGSKQLEQVPSSMEIPRNLANTWAKGFLKKTLTTQKPKMSIFFF